LKCARRLAISQELNGLQTTRLERIRRVQESGETGALTVSFDLGAGYDSDALALLIDDDGAFGAAALVSASFTIASAPTYRAYIPAILR